MCGMAGAYSSTWLSNYELEHVRRLTILNHFRGSHSIGMMTYHKELGQKKNVYSHWKSAIHPFEFTEGIFDKKYVDDKWVKDKPSLVATHCRAATKGKVSKDNAHPFVFDHIIGMHNGTIHATQPDENKFETDSEALYYNISKNGLQKALNSMNGGQIALALVWLDAKEGTLNFYRNVHRPLHVWHAGGTIYWSSESKDLDYVLTRGRTETKNKMGKPMREPLSVNTEMLFKVDLSQKGEIVWTAESVKKEYNVPQRNFTTTTTPPRMNMGGVGSSTNGSIASKRAEISSAYVAIPWNLLKEDPSAIKQVVHFVCSDKAPYYALEFDGFLPSHYMLAVLLWRKFFFKQYVKLLSERYLQHSDKRAFLRDMQRAGMSKNVLKKLLKYRNCDYIEKPFLPRLLAENKISTLTHPEILPAAFVPWELERARNYANQSYKNTDNVLPFTPKEEDIDNDLADLVPIGISQSFVTEEEARKLLNSGCEWCGDPIDFSEIDFVHWTGEKKCLCISCMESIFAGTISGAGVPYVEKIAELLEYREKSLEEVYKTEVTN